MTIVRRRHTTGRVPAPDRSRAGAARGRAAAERRAIAAAVAPTLEEVRSELDAVDVALADEIAAKASLSSPALTATPTAPTAAPGTNTTQLATTAFVQAAALAAAMERLPDGVEVGDLIYWGGSAWVSLQPKDLGDVLTLEDDGGGGKIPGWAAPTGGGGSTSLAPAMAMASFGGF